MFREKEICNAIRTAYLYLFPDKKERKKVFSRLNMELVAQSVRYRGESVLAYQTAGNYECSLNYYGPELFPQRGFCIYQKTIQSHSTQVDASCIRELWLLEDGRFVEVSCVNTKYRSAYERFPPVTVLSIISSGSGTGRTIQRRRLPTPLRTSAAIPLMGDSEFSMKFEPRLY